jgi:indolepyruvate ferredoxin oxidoreductase alpha subunit
MSTPRKIVGRERSFAREVAKLQLGDGETFHGETILAVTKALLQAGVSYVGGYPGAPVSHLMDVLADARDTVLAPMGVQFEASASEAGAAALLGASIHYPLRGAVTWKSIVGTNVASDALSNLASAGVVGGALIVVGEDYGEGASVIQERTYATAMKSALPFLEPRYHLPTVVELIEAAFELSEASHLPCILSMRIRAAHMTGSFRCKDNRPPRHGANRPDLKARYDYGRIVLPPSTYAQEKAKVGERLPAARRFIVERGLNETFGPADGRHGIILQGGAHGTVLRGLRLLGAADALGGSQVPLLVLNVTYPLVPEQIAGFLADKDSVLVVEEGQPAFMEQQIKAIAQEAGLRCRIHGKDLLPEAGEYTADTVRAGLHAYLAEADKGAAGRTAKRRAQGLARAVKAAHGKLSAAPIPARPPGFCTGCPERPVFTALKLLQRERGPMHVSSDIGCNTFSTLPPFNIGSTVLGYGLSLASGGAVGPALGAPTVAIMGDGGFWHNGLTSGAINAHWNGHDGVLVILENGYAAATGQHHLPSTGATPWGRRIRVSMERTLRGLGIRWVRRVNAYRLKDAVRTLRAALDARGDGLRVVISDQECMLARQRRERPAKAAAAKAGRTVVFPRFGIDEQVCVGDHSCMRVNGCPSLTLKDTGDPLKLGPVAHIDASCVGCGLCGEVVHALTLCPSFYRAERIVNPGPWRRLSARLSRPLMAALGAS